jgi:hypothetical protein
MTTTPPAESIFFAALAKTDPAERAAYLDEACGGDGDLRRQVERLLEAHPQVGSFLDRPLADRPAGVAGPGEGAAATQAPDAGAAPEFLTPSDKPGVLGRLDHYDVLEVVGRGGMGIVLKAFDEKLRRVVAIKVLAPELAAGGTARQRFTREARAAAAVSHEHVVTIHAVEDGRRPPYLVMQFVAGVALQEKLDRHGPLGLKEILRIGLQTAEGLAAAHRQGLVHRDIKPANILLENGVERVKITDFGLARAVDDASLTQSGAIAGTPLYMSPEQAAGAAVDPRSDLFSLGSVLYALCTGRPPFRADGTHAVLRRVIEDAPRPIAEVNPDIPAWLCDFIARLHAKQPACRFQSAEEVADLLRQALAHVQQPSQGAPPGAVAKPGAATAPRKRRWRGAAGGLMLLGLAVGLVLASLAGGLFQAPEPSPPQSHGLNAGPDRGGGREKGPPAGGEQPAAREILDELRKLVATQQEDVRQVRLSFQADRVGKWEVCDAEARLIEARIKLAAAEHKSVLPLLEDLVRNREEALKVVEARFDAGALPKTEALAIRRQLSEARIRLATARGGSAATQH